MLLLCPLQAIITMVPEAWQNDSYMPAEKRNFYRWSAYSMEPWDGPGESLLYGAMGWAW